MRATENPDANQAGRIHTSGMTSYTSDPARLGEVRLGDGRLLGWAEWGPPDGVPVLLCSGAATSRWLGLHDEVAEALGVRLVSVDRPGLGTSTPAPGRTLADFAHDMRQLVSLRGLGRPAVLANSQGAPFALACAHEGLASALALVSAADEVAAPEFADILPAGLRETVDRTVNDPASAHEFFARFSTDAMWGMVMSNAPQSDLAVFREAGFAAAYRRSLGEAFSQGSAGYARDTVLAMSRWPIPFGHISVPVQIWYGEHDTTHSPDHGQLLAARLPNSRRHTVPNIGAAVLWTHTTQILTQLLRATPPRR